MPLRSEADGWQPRPIGRSAALSVDGADGGAVTTAADRQVGGFAVHRAVLVWALAISPCHAATCFLRRAKARVPAVPSTHKHRVPGREPSADGGFREPRWYSSPSYCPRFQHWGVGDVGWSYKAVVGDHVVLVRFSRSGAFRRHLDSGTDPVESARLSGRHFRIVVERRGWEQLSDAEKATGLRERP
jgi:hypothetical protein